MPIEPERSTPATAPLAPQPPGSRLAAPPAPATATIAILPGTAPAPGRSPLRILITLLYYLPHRTGYSIYVQRLAEALAARGHQVTLVCARHQSTLAPDEWMNGVRVLRLWAPLSVSRGMVMPAYPLTLDRLARNADVIVANTPMAETALVAWTARRRRKPLVAIHHGDLVLPPGPGNRLIASVMLGLHRVLAREARRLVVCNEDYARSSSYLAAHLEKVCFLTPPVRTPRPDREKARELREKCSDGGAPLIGFAGRFVAEKRPDLLLRALDGVRERHPRARLVFAGQYDIPYEDTWSRCRELVEARREQLVFLGPLPEPQQMADFYAALDVLALPSDTESFALVQAEAMLCGTPVVATDTPGARMPIIETGMGRIVPRGDIGALSAALADVIAQRAKYVRPESQIQQTFDQARTVDRFEQLLATVVSEAASGS